MIVTAQMPKSLAEMQAAHKARQARFQTAARVQSKVLAKLEQEPKAIPLRIKPIWMFGHTSFDHHVLTFQSFFEQRRRAGGHRIKQYILTRATELGSSYAEVLSHSRKRRLVAIRDQIIWEIKTQVKPEISFPELGRLMGGRDHTSILHSYRKMEAMASSADSEAIMEAAR